jgi:hypothetical protein
LSRIGIAAASSAKDHPRRNTLGHARQPHLEVLSWFEVPSWFEVLSWSGEFLKSALPMRQPWSIDSH